MRLRSDSARRGLTGIAIACLFLFFAAAAYASDDERGTIGIRFRQLFDERQPSHRGPLVVLRVEDESPAAKAGSTAATSWSRSTERRSRDASFRNFGFTPDLSKVTAAYREDPPASQTYGSAPARTYSGTVSIWDTHGKVIHLNSEIAQAQCPGSGHTALFVGMSLEPRDGPVWKAIDAVRDTFRCSR